MATDQEIRAVREILYPLRSPCIVELGAHTGEDEPWLRAACREDVHYVMVEPDIRNAQLIINGGLTRTRRLIVAAITERDGDDVEFHGSVDATRQVRGSGSIRPPKEHERLFPNIAFPADRKTMVPALTLDTLFEREWLTKIDLLWADLQGAEKDMILGGRNALSHTRYLFIETEDRELYEGMALKPELLGMLEGWTLIGDFGYNCLLRNERFKERVPR
jgi:FkbM family methyltransferase